MPKGYVTPREITCAGCQQVFMATGTRSRFCSRKCIDKEQWDKRNRKEVICKQCGRVSKINHSRSFCSNECKVKYYGHKDGVGRQKYYLKRNYNITVEDYSQLLESQGNKCGLCKKSDIALSIDHDHKCCSGVANSCGKCIRGLLCRKCNTGLGNFNDSPEMLHMAIEYINSHRSESNS